MCQRQSQFLGPTSTCRGSWPCSLCTWPPRLSHPLVNKTLPALYDAAVSGITRAAIESSDNHFLKSRISIPTKLKLYNTCILPRFLYGPECWAVTKVDALLSRSLVLENTAWNQMAAICSQRGGEEDSSAIAERPRDA